MQKATATTVKGEMDTNTVRAGGLHTRLPSTHRSSRHKINKGTQAFNNHWTTGHFLHMQSAFHPNEAGYTLLSRAHPTFPRTDHMLRHQASHCTWKEIEILSHSLYEPNAMRLEINHQENNGNKHQRTETRQHATQQPRECWRNQRGNLKIPRSK